MKWPVVGLMFLGVIAATCAVLLVSSIQADASRRDNAAADGANAAEVEVLVAAKDLPAMTIIEGGDVVAKAVPEAQAPAGYLSSTQVVGKVLVTHMVTGQPFTSSCFPPEGSGLNLAAALRDGMRAVSVSLSDYAGLSGVLYPGSVVDVLVSLKLPSEEGVQGEYVSSTLLQGIQVLAIEDRTVVSSAGEKEDAPQRIGRGSAPQTITLMVDAKQAVLLQLAREHGSVSLAMRSPMDQSPADTGGVLLSELSPEYFGRLARLTNPAREPGVSVPVPAAPPAPAPKRPRRWDVDVYRAGTLETRSFAVPEDGDDQQANDPE